MFVSYCCVQVVLNNKAQKLLCCSIFLDSKFNTEILVSCQMKNIMLKNNIPLILEPEGFPVGYKTKGKLLRYS